MKKEKTDFYEFHVCTNNIEDRFVGIKSAENKIKICFPLGYCLSDTEEGKREDTKLLIKILSHFKNKAENVLMGYCENKEKYNEFPLTAYLNVIEEYLDRGYYVESETVYTNNKSGKINWSMTIHKQKAYPQDEAFFYLNFISRKNVINSSNLITKINEYCVEESYNKLGWIFCSCKPKKSDVVFQEKEFIDLLNKKISQTCNDRDRNLFLSMREMIKFIGREGENCKFYFGTNEFEYIWEKLIDSSFGVKNKNYYFPHTTWRLKNGSNYSQSALEPDTIMLSGKKIFILDAKYYKYGITGNPKDLPKSTSINKQITYGEFIATESKFKALDKKSPTVFNAFIMPFNKHKNPFGKISDMVYIGEAYGSWKTSGLDYERVQGILLDVKWLMSKLGNRCLKSLNELAKFIENNSVI